MGLPVGKFSFPFLSSIFSFFEGRGENKFRNEKMKKQQQQYQGEK